MQCVYYCIYFNKSLQIIHNYFLLQNCLLFSYFNKQQRKQKQPHEILYYLLTRNNLHTTTNTTLQKFETYNGVAAFFNILKCDVPINEYRY